MPSPDNRTTVEQIYDRAQELYAAEQWLLELKHIQPGPDWAHLPQGERDEWLDKAAKEINA